MYLIIVQLMVPNFNYLKGWNVLKKARLHFRLKKKKRISENTGAAVGKFSMGLSRYRTAW